MSNRIFVDLSAEQQQLLVGGVGNNTTAETPKVEAKAVGTMSLDPVIRIPIAIGPIKIPEFAAELQTEITSK